jgi:DNA-binding MarR family transcriptional regulator
VSSRKDAEMETKRFQLLSPWLREALEYTNAIERAGRMLIAARRGMSLSYGLTICGWRVLTAISQLVDEQSSSSTFDGRSSPSTFDGGSPSSTFDGRSPSNTFDGRSTSGPLRVLSMAAISRRLRLTRQTTQAVVHELRRDGWVVLQRYQSDRRIFTLTLTPRATRTVANLEHDMRALLLEVTRELTRETLSNTTADLERITGRLRRCRQIVEKRTRQTRRGKQRAGRGQPS